MTVLFGILTLRLFEPIGFFEEKKKHIVVNRYTVSCVHSRVHIPLKKKTKRNVTVNSFQRKTKWIHTKSRKQAYNRFYTLTKGLHPDIMPLDDDYNRPPRQKMHIWLWEPIPESSVPWVDSPYKKIQSTPIEYILQDIASHHVGPLTTDLKDTIHSFIMRNITAVRWNWFEELQTIRYSSSRHKTEISRKSQMDNKNEEEEEGVPIQCYTMAVEEAKATSSPIISSQTGTRIAWT